MSDNAQEALIALRYMSEGYDNHFNAGTPLMALHVAEVDARIAELYAKVLHDEDNLEGLQHALIRANQQYIHSEVALVDKQREVVAALQTAVDMEAERDALRQGYEILATKLSEANAELVRLETQPRPD